ncbi:MAG: response regulator [Chloroflexota bacterium]
MTHKLLVVDDHPETLDIITSVLAQHEYKVFSARSGFQGLSIAEKESPDLIMVDGMMPEMDGWEFCRRIRSNPNLAQTPIIMFSAEDSPRQKLAGFDAGADDYLTKPTEPDELVERVEVLLNSSKTHKHNMSAVQVEQDTRSHDLMGTRHVGSDQLEEPKSQKSQVIVVMGARGGVGTTTTAINVAASLAASGRSTLLLDLDQTQGHVAVYLKQKVSREAKRLPTLSPEQIPGHLPSAMISWNDHLKIIPSRANLLGNYQNYSPEQLKAICNTVVKPNSFLVIDAGRGVSPLTSSILEEAHHILVCLRPERVALAAARRLMVLWQKAMFSTSKIHPIILDFNNNREIPQQAIESYLGRPLYGIVPINSQEFTQSVNKGIPLVQLIENSVTAFQFKQLAQKITTV